MSIKVRGFRHVLIPTDQLELTRSFYVDLLGLQHKTIPPLNIPPLNLEWVASGDVELHIVEKAPDISRQMGTSMKSTLEPHIAFEVDDISVARESLVKAGHEILSESTIDYGVIGRAQLFVRDPSGLAVELYQEVSKPVA